MKNGLILVPNADGYVLKDTVKNIWKNGKMHHIPYMVGSTGNDLGMSPEEAAQGVPGLLQKEGKLWAEKTEEIYKNPAYLYWFTHKLPGMIWEPFILQKSGMYTVHLTGAGGRWKKRITVSVKKW